MTQPTSGEQSPPSAAWDFLVGGLSDADADAFLDVLEHSPDHEAALVEAADDVVLLRSLGDAELREYWAGPGVEDIDLDALLDDSHHPDRLLDEALADGEARASSWRRFLSFSRRPTVGATAVLLVAALALLFIMVPQPEPVPDYSSAWRTGASETRASTGEKGRYKIGNFADLVVRPETTGAPEAPEIRVFVGRNGGSLEPVEAETTVSASGAVRVLFEVTPQIGLGTHRVVVLVGRKLTDADPETDTDDWARVETDLRVVE
jgi:hypothetical protein